MPRGTQADARLRRHEPCSEERFNGAPRRPRFGSIGVGRSELAARVARRYGRPVGGGKPREPRRSVGQWASPSNGRAERDVLTSGRLQVAPDRADDNCDANDRPVAPSPQDAADERTGISGKHSRNPHRGPPTPVGDRPAAGAVGRSLRPAAHHHPGLHRDRPSATRSAPRANHRWSGGRPTDAPDRRDGADHGNHRRPAHPHGDRCSDTGSGRAPDGTGPPIHDDTAARPEHYTTGGTGAATAGGIGRTHCTAGGTGAATTGGIGCTHCTAGGTGTATAGGIGCTHCTAGGTGTATVGGGSWQPESARPLSRLPDPVTGGSNRVRENWGKVRARV